jgi:hypothetical protein
MFERKKLLDTSNPKAFKIYSCNVRGGSINCNANLQRKKDGKNLNQAGSNVMLMPLLSSQRQNGAWGAILRDKNGDVICSALGSTLSNGSNG